MGNWQDHQLGSLNHCGVPRSEKVQNTTLRSAIHYSGVCCSFPYYAVVIWRGIIPHTPGIKHPGAGFT